MTAEVVARKGSYIRKMIHSWNSSVTDVGCLGFLGEEGGEDKKV